MLQVHGLYGSRLSPDTVILSVEEDIDGMGTEEGLFWGVLWNDAVFVVKLHVM